jgi:hypothetical protein
MMPENISENIVIAPIENSLECSEEMPSNLKRRRVLPPMFLSPPLPETESDDMDSDREILTRMRLAAEILFGDLEDRQAEVRRETTDYNEGDTPQTSQESKLSEYNWSTRDGSEMVPLDEILEFIWKNIARERIFNRVTPFLSVSEEMFERDPDRVKELVAHVLDCEPVLLFNILNDAIEESEEELDGED